MLQKGFIPTQIADSFAISSGGATMYRNRIKKYVKDGMTEKQAEKQAWLDFQEITETNQQSARPDLISQQQANPLGRLILAFANTPMQYMRIMKKSARDLKNGRGDAKTHISRIVYYGAIQSFIFAALQSALFSVIGSEDEDEINEKQDRILNTMIDSWLRGMGYGGSALSSIKNTLIEYFKQRDKDLDEDYNTRSDHAYTIIQALNFSPPIGSKIRKLYSAIQTEKFNRDLMLERGFTLDNPAWSAVGNLVEAVTNIPLGRLSNKMNNIDNAINSDIEAWKRVALIMGWNTWDLDVKDPDIEKLKTDIKERKKEERKEQKLREKYPDKTDIEIEEILKSKEIFDLNKEEQVDILENLGLSEEEINSLDKEQSRVDKIIDLYKESNENKEIINSKSIDKETEEIKEDEIEVDLKKKSKQIFDLNKKEQVKILEANNLNSKDFPKEQNRVDKIMELYNENPNKIDSTLNAIENYVPTKWEKRSIDIYSMTKTEQINLLISFGYPKYKIKRLKYEEDRVNEILKIEKRKESK